MDLFSLYPEGARSGITADEAVKIFAEALQDPANPRRCAGCLLGCLVVIQAGPMNKEILQEKYHDFWSTAIRFVTFGRTFEAMEALDEAVCDRRCTCEPDNAKITKLHVLSLRINLKAQKGAYGTLAALVSCIYQIFSITITQVKAVIVAKGRHKKSLWPTSPQDLIPYGACTSYLYMKNT